MFVYRSAAATLAAAVIAIFAATAHAGANDYRFEVSGKPQSAAGKSVVHVRLIHAPDGKPVSGAVLIQSKVDMSPMSMAEMTAPVKALGEAEPGVYRFEIQPGMAGKWALILAAKVQGETETVSGTLTVDLVK